MTVPPTVSATQRSRHAVGRRRGVALASAGVVGALLLTACSGSSSGKTATTNSAAVKSNTAGAGITIDIVGCSATDPFCGAWKKGADDAANQTGAKVTYIGADVTANGLSKALQTAQASKPNGIAAGNWFPDTENPILKDLAANGTAVMLANAAPIGWETLPWALGFVGQSDEGAGEAAGAALAKAGGKNVLCVNNTPGAQNQIDRCNGVKKSVVAAGGKSSVLNIPYADVSNPAAIQQAIGGALSNDKSIDAMTILSPQAQQGAALKKKYPNIKIGVFDLSTAVLTSIKSGDFEFVINQQPYLQGYNSVLALYTQIKYGTGPVGQIKTGPQVVDKTNVDKLLEVNKKYPGVLGAA